MRLFRSAATALAVLLAGDLLVLVVTGSTSLVTPGATSVGGGGFALRATALGALLILRFRMLVPREERMNGARLLLILLLLPTLVQFQVVGPQTVGDRLSGVDAMSYYAFLRSMLKDRDFDLANEYTRFGMIGRPDLSKPTKTGLRRSIYSVGPAVAWTPFFLLGEGFARVQAVLAGRADLSGYGRPHRNATALGSLLYGFGAILLIHSLLRRHFREATALGAALLVWGATFFHFYLVFQPLYANNTSTFLAAAILWLWDRDRERRGAWEAFFLGVVLGLAMCVRWQNGVLLALPGLELLARWRREPRALPQLAGLGALVGLGTFIGAFPQMAAWKALYDVWVLPYPPHGADFVRLDHPWILETLFSSRHGLLSWTPALWAGYLGFVPLLRRRPALALPLVPPLVLMTYVNMCAGDWWAGGSFSNRRFDSLLPLLALGFAASIDVARGQLRRRPGLAPGLAAVGVVAWNVTLVAQVQRGLLPADDTVAFPALAEGSARMVSASVGFPTTWPASWIFAWRHRRPPSQYEVLVGRYLFYRQNSLGPRVDLGEPEFERLLGEGWGPPASVGGASGRRLLGRGRLFAPLDVPEDLELRFRVSAGAGGILRVLVNGRETGRFDVPEPRAIRSASAPAERWRRELNEVTLDAGGREVFVHSVEFVRGAQGP